MLGSVLLPANPPGGPRRNTYSSTTVAPPLPPRKGSLSTAPAAKTAPLQLKSVTLSGGMESRYNRPSSPRRGYANPARSSTGTFADPYYDSSRYGRPSSPRSSVDRLSAASNYHSPYWNQPSTLTGSHSSTHASSTHKYDSYTTRPRRNTNDLTRPNVSTSALPQTSLPLRTPYSPHTTTHTERPRSPLTPSYGKPDTYITPGTSRGHKKVYSVDDTSHLTKLVAEVDSSRHRDHADRGYNITSGGRSYHDSKPPARLSDLSNEGYSYTDPASMYRDTEPAWRRPRAGSMERGSRPTSMIADRPARNSTRELGPPPSTRGFDKIHPAPRPHGRSSSIERTSVPKYDPYPDSTVARSSSTRSRAPAAIHQEPREHRRDTYPDDYDRREVENKRHSTAFEDREVTSRGFGIAPGPPTLAHDQYALDRQPLYPPQQPPRPRPQEPSSPYYQPERAEARMPEPRASRDRDVPPPDYDRRPREREHGKHDEHKSNGFVSTVAGAVTGAAATLAGAGFLKNRDKDRGSDRDSSGERERERRKEQDERDRRDRPDERRERKSEGRRNSLAPPPPPPVAAAAAAAPPPPPAAPAQIAAPEYSAYADLDRKPRDRRHEDDDKEKVSVRKPSSPEGSGDERPRHYVDRDAERRKEPAPQQAAVDPDEEYRRRIQQEAERANRGTRDRDSDSDRERDRRRRRDERKDDRDRSRSRSRGPEDRSRASPPRDAPPSTRFDERSASTHDGGMVQEPEALDRALEPTGKSVQIVEPPKEPVAPVKGILRKPTAKFPEDPEPIREGVAPHKDALKGKDIPVGARWTRIDRRLVNPEALEQAKERFEERMDCVIVLRVLTKEEIQKLADRTKKIRESREDDEYDHERRDRDDRDRRSRRSKDDRDDEDRDGDRDRHYHDRDRRRRYDDESEYDDRDRDRERERERPKKAEFEDGR